MNTIWFYLKGIPTGDFSGDPAVLVDKDTPGLSAPTISRLKSIWEEVDNYLKGQFSHVENLNGWEIIVRPLKTICFGHIIVPTANIW